MDQALFALYRRSAVSLETALENAESANDLSLRIRLEEGLVVVADEETGAQVADGPEREEPRRFAVA
jgi:Tfp pilus assembly ATPase PilU